MTQYLLDTNVVIDLIRGKDNNVRQHILEVGVDRCAICDLTAFELLYGAYKSQNREQNLRLVHTLIDQIAVIPSSSAYELAAREKVRLQQAGHPIEDFDLLIGCTAIIDHRPLVSNNLRHLTRLSRLTDLTLTDWQ